MIDLLLLQHEFRELYFYFPYYLMQNEKKLCTVVLKDLGNKRQCYFAKDNPELWDSTSDLFCYIMGK